jgi:diphthamide synthase (EF-2-diphthine--ammonia ligase)
MIESSNDISADCLFMGSCYRKTTLESLGQTLSVVRYTYLWHRVYTITACAGVLK